MHIICSRFYAANHHQTLASNYLPPQVTFEPRTREVGVSLIHRCHGTNFNLVEIQTSQVESPIRCLYQV